MPADLLLFQALNSADALRRVYNKLVGEKHGETPWNAGMADVTGAAFFVGCAKEEGRVVRKITVS